MATLTQETIASPAESSSKRSQLATARSGPKRKPAPSAAKSTPKTRSASRPHSKQDRVVSMLRRIEGATVAAVMKVTGWQKHSVHGFFAGVVRKKLGLNVVSAKADGKRIYRIAESKTGKSANTGKRANTAAPTRKQAAA